MTAGAPDRFRYLHLFALSSLAVAQPLLDLLARDAGLFVVRRAGGGEILALVAALLVLVPLPLVTLAALARRVSPRLGAGVQALAVGALAALLAFLTLTRLALLDGPAWWVAGLAAGGAFAWAYRRFRAARLLCTYLGLGLVVVPASFLFDLSLSRILAGGPDAELHVSGARDPVVFVVFDELSLTALLDERREIDAVSYPHLAAFATEAYWFRNASTASDATELAVPALLTGRIPERGRVAILSNHPRNLFTALGGDYRVWAAEPVSELCPAALNAAEGGVRAAPAELATLFSDLWIVYRHLLLPPRYAGRLPPISDRWQGFGRPLTSEPQDGPAAPRRDRRQELRRFLDAFDPEQPRTLYFLHVLLPHTPWEYMPSGRSYGAGTDRVPGLGSDDAWQREEAHVVQAYQRYLLQIRLLDRWIGELTDRLRDLDLYERSLIVVAADHGISFRPGDSRRMMSATNAHDLIPVPLLIKAPHQRRGEVVDRPVSTLDVLPTVLDLLDVDPPWPFDGRSAFAAAADTARHRVVGRYRDFDLGHRIHRDKYATLSWKLDTFGVGDAVWRAGTHPELYGRKVDEISWRRQDEVVLRLEAAESAFSPAFVSGGLRTSSADSECCDLAVAVDGTLYGTARTYGTPPDLRFIVLVPESVFGDGPSRLDVFRVRRGGPRPELELLGSSNVTPQARRSGGSAAAEPGGPPRHQLPPRRFAAHADRDQRSRPDPRAAARQNASSTPRRDPWTVRRRPSTSCPRSSTCSTSIRPRTLSAPDRTGWTSSASAAAERGPSSSSWAPRTAPASP